MLQVLMSLSIATQCLTQIVPESEKESASSHYGPTYQFKYHVDDLTTMDFKTHEEIGENGSVRGTYTVREPNGDLRVVSYTAGDSGGFQAMVRVKPTASAEQESVVAEQTINQTAVPAKNSKNLMDAPLKLQLDTGRRVYQKNNREQRQSNPSKQGKITVLPGSLHQEEMIFPPPTHQKPQDVGPNTTQHTRQVKEKEDTHETTLKPSKGTTTLYQDSQTANNTKTQPNTEKQTKPKLQKGILPKSKRNPNQAPIFLSKQNVATAYLPYPVRPIQQGPHYGHIFAPVLLHILPASTPSDTDIIHPKDSPPAQSSEAGQSNIEPALNKNENKLCSTEFQ